MAGKIRVLPSEVVELIAAGEVVERPSSCIKELVENSLDAGATAVSVSIEGGGLDMIRVTDNGGGIAPTDLNLVFMPHATSKLNRAEDLHRVITLGFRGEALPSIARVSKVTLQTRQKGEQSGMKAVNEGGKLISVTEAACAEGTQITVKDLFYNAPVRRDFMKKPQRETALCAELMEQLILSRPDVAFRFTADGKLLFSSPGDGQLKNALLTIYGLATMKALVPVDGNGQGLLVKGFLGVGEQARGNRGHQHFFLNGRAVRSTLLSRAVEEACRHRVMTGRYPMFALNLSLPYELVDVNVHPNKWEVRFSNEQAVLSALTMIVSDALQTAPLESPPPLFEAPVKRDEAQVTRLEPGAEKIVQVQAAPEVHQEPQAARAFTARDIVREQTLTPEPKQEAPAIPAPKPAPEKAEQVESPVLSKEDRKIRVLGVAFHTYIILQQGERILLIDQHALHERLLFDKLMASAHTTQPSQTLLLPVVMDLDYPNYQAFLAYREDLAQAGFEAEEFGDRAVRLLSVPVELGEPLAERSFQDALDELKDRGSLSGQSRRERIIMASCKHAVKGGERLPEDALQHLVDEMLDKGTIPTCPHGRPIALELTRRELEKRFRRIQD